MEFEISVHCQGYLFQSIKDSFMATIRGKLSTLKSRIMKRLKLNKEQQADLDKRMKVLFKSHFRASSNFTIVNDWFDTRAYMHKRVYIG